MNDDQLSAELRRRSAAAHVAPDWPRSVMLPAVREEIDTRPQRVPSSSWVPRFGVAALVVALLVLVVALPRLGPQPPAASPTPADDGVLTTSEFAGYVAHGQLRGQTVLVRGRISVGDLFSRPNTCTPPTGTCALGVLEGTSPPLGIEGRYTPTTDAPGSGSWEALDGGRDYHFPTPPIAGVLALRVLGEADVEFVGLVHETTTSNALTVADASALDPTTLAPDAAVLVRGFLVDTSRPGEFVDIDCTLNPYPVISGLPNRFCTITDFLSSISPNTDFGPNPDRLRVQVGAADRFAFNFQGREALYAISPRLYGGCDDGSPPPCWLWDVVARVDGPPAGVPPTPSPSPSPSSSLVGVAIDCPPTWPVNTLHATILDQTGLVLACDKPVEPMFDWTEDHPVQVGNPGGDTGLLQVEWVGNPCDASVLFTLSRSGNAFVMEGRNTFSGSGCIEPRVVHAILLTIGSPIYPSNVLLTWNADPGVSPPPSPSPSVFPTPGSGVRTFTCANAEAPDSEITLIDHSGRISACSMTQRQSVQSSIDGPIDITATDIQNQLAAWWPVNLGCPADEQLEFWGPVDQPIGLAEFVLQLAHQRLPQFDPIDCGNVVDIRQVRFDLANNVQPEDILAIAVDRWMVDSAVSNQAVSGAFDLQLAAPHAFLPGEPIDIASTLSYHGVDPVTLSGWWQPDFVFTSLTGGPSFDSYGTILVCPGTEADLSADDVVSGHLAGPADLDPADPNYAYREEYAYDGQFRLPAGAYLIYTGLNFNAGANCSGDRVRLRSAIVIEVGLIGSSGILGSP